MIPIAEIRSDYYAQPKADRAAYRYPLVTEEEVASALEFAFPSIRGTTLALNFGSVTVACECGEDSFAAAVALPRIRITCICGRRWRVGLVLEPDGEANGLLHAVRSGHDRDQMSSG